MPPELAIYHDTFVWVGLKSRTGRGSVSSGPWPCFRASRVRTAFRPGSGEADSPFEPARPPRRSCPGPEPRRVSPADRSRPLAKLARLRSRIARQGRWTLDPARRQGRGGRHSPGPHPGDSSRQGRSQPSGSANSGCGPAVRDPGEGGRLHPVPRRFRTTRRPRRRGCRRSGKEARCPARGPQHLGTRRAERNRREESRHQRISPGPRHQDEDACSRRGQYPPRPWLSRPAVPGRRERRDRQSRGRDC